MRSICRSPFSRSILEEMQLPPGLALRMGDIQAVTKWRLSGDHYLRSLGRALPNTLRAAEQKGAASAPAERCAGAGDVADLGGGVRIELAWCPAGSFLMGSPVGEAERLGDEAQHWVTLTKGIWMGKHPVTQRQWEAVTGSNPSAYKGAESGLGASISNGGSPFGSVRIRTGSGCRGAGIRRCGNATGMRRSCLT